MNTYVALLMLFGMFVGYHFGGYVYAVNVAIGFALLALLINLIRR
jgi:putative Mn2+ efflux pump MntP